MKTLQALVLGTSILALGGIASAQDRVNSGAGASPPAPRMMQDRNPTPGMTGRGGDPEAHQNGRRIVGSGDVTTRHSRWRNPDGYGRWDRRWRQRGYTGRGYYGWRDRDWYDPYGPFAGGYTGFWPFPAFTAFDPGYYEEPVVIAPAPRRRVWVERRGRYGYGPYHRGSVSNPARGAHSGN